MSKQAEAPLVSGRKPEHVAIVMDGNGRWARGRGLPRHAGHKAGVDSVRSTVEVCLQEGVGALTLFAFSSENWRRPKTEVSLLLELFMTALQREVKRLKANNVRLRIIGDRSAFAPRLRDKIGEAERLTQDNDGLMLQVAANYGGRWDVTQAARRIAELAVDGLVDPASIDEDMLARFSSFNDIPDPDLFIRTGGELRISNFLLWHCAYSELYFTPTLWPDFDAEAMRTALREFASRQRRFGQTGDQVGQKVEA